MTLSGFLYSKLSFEVNKMPGLRNRLILLLLICLISSSVVSGIEIVGNIEESATWTASNSPYIINDVTTIESDVLLTIESGVIVKFGTGAGFIIDGLLHARGTETDSIVFTSLDAAEPGTWGGLLFSGGSDEELWDSDDQFSGEGSILDHCILEYGGGSSEFSSVVSVTFSSLYITNSLIQNCLGETGTIHCGNISKLMIEKSKVINNTADLGGAISLGLGTFSVIRDNIFVQNSARDKGGAIYLTRGETKLNRNSFLLNEAANYGGAIYIAGSQNILLENNVLLGNKSGFGAQTLGIQDDVNIKITGNIFAQTKNAICLRNAVNDVEATENFWGRKDTTDFRQFILDRNQNAREPYVNYHPMLLAPIENIHTNPVEVISIHLCRDDTYTSDIPRGVANGAPMRIRLDAVTVNPYTPDLIRVKVVSTLDPEGVLIPLVETDANSGIFIGRGEIALDSDEEMFTIGDEIGGIVTIFAPFYPDVKAEYATMSAKPLVENYAILETPDSLHLINHNPTFIWDYFEGVGRPQTNYRFRVYEINEDGLVSEAIHWDSKETPSEYHNIHYKGTELEDGQTYLAKLKVFSSYLWSDSYDMLFRMNSLPTPPVAQRPAHDELTITVKPELVAATSIDRET
ncbi:right-handed parallel beta-helix repeat-containing protein, partial [bacterium]|nr:right-handed parallel beta-helix repeat-containing protein [bacterium]